MFRHEALRPLSRGHQRVLFHAREMRRHPETAFPAFLAFARETLPRHLEAEERFLFPLLLAHVPEGDPTIERALAAHAAIRAGIARLTDAAAGMSPEAEAIRELALVLHDHVRDEERNLFPLAERALGAEGLADVARKLGDAYVI